MGITDNFFLRDYHRWESGIPQRCMGDLLCSEACSRTFLELLMSIVGYCFEAVEGGQPGLVLGALSMASEDGPAHPATAIPLL